MICFTTLINSQSFDNLINYIRVTRQLMTNKPENNDEEEMWYIHVNQQVRGPFGLRDLDVLLRTNEINSRTLGWKSEMKEWKPINQIQQIKISILQSSNELLQIQRKKVNLLDAKGQSKPGENNVEQNSENSESQDHQIQNNDEDPLTILEVTVENLLKKSFNQSTDGKWNIYDEEKGEWMLQDQQPTQKINKMKNHLFNKLKSELFFGKKEKKASKYNEPQKPQENLTKEELEKRQKNRKKTKRAAQKKKQKWYQAKINTYIYLSGLPFDVSEEELKEFASKAGVLRIDLNTGKQKIKIYKDQNDFPKGDAAISYARQESVDLAIQILNGREIREGFVVSVERAKFNQKNEQYIPRELKKQSKIQKILAKKNEQKQLAWDDEVEEAGDGFRIVIMKHILTPEICENQAEVDSIKHDLESQLSKIGEIKRIKFYEHHPDGVVQIKFKNDKDAESCIQIMNNRFFDGREIVCEYWDGQTNYNRDGASLALQQESLQKYAEMLEGKGNHQQKDKNKPGESVVE